MLPDSISIEMAQIGNLFTTTVTLMEVENYGNAIREILLIAS